MKSFQQSNRNSKTTFVLALAFVALMLSGCGATLDVKDDLTFSQAEPKIPLSLALYVPQESKSYSFTVKSPPPHNGIYEPNIRFGESLEKNAINAFRSVIRRVEIIDKPTISKNAKFDGLLILSIDEGSTGAKYIPRVLIQLVKEELWANVGLRLVMLDKNDKQIWSSNIVGRFDAKDNPNMITLNTLAPGFSAATASRPTTFSNHWAVTSSADASYKAQQAAGQLGAGVAQLGGAIADVNNAAKLSSASALNNALVLSQSELLNNQADIIAALGSSHTVANTQQE